MTSQSRPPRLARNALANGILFFLTALVGFFLSPFLVRHLGATTYGVWTLLAGLVGYLGLLDLGIRQAVNRYVAHHRAVGAHDETSSIVSAAVRLFGLLGIVAILLSTILAYFAPIFFNIPPSLIVDTRIVVVVGGVTVAVSLIGGVFGGAVTGIERFDINCYVETAVMIVRTVGVVLALSKGFSLVALAFVQLAASVVSCLLFGTAVRRLYPELRLLLRGPLLPQLRTILSFGASLSIVQILAALTQQSDSAIIGALLPIESVTFFAIAATLCVYAKEMTRSLAYVMTPRVSALISMGSKRVGEDILGVAGMATLLAAPMAVTFILRGQSFIALWMGPQFGPPAGGVLRVLAIVVWLEASRSVIVHSLAGMGKQRTLIPGAAFEAACKLALSIALARPLGITGVALGTLVPCVLINMGYIPRRLAQVADVPVGLFHRRALLLPTAACVPFALASACIERFMPAGNLVVFFAQVVVILPLVPLSAWFLCLTAAEKDRVRSTIRSVVGG